MEIPEVIALLEQYGTGGALVVLVGVLLRYLIPALKSLKVNPSLGEHLGEIQARLRTIESASKITSDLAVKTWDKINAKL